MERGREQIVLFDGVCNFCNASVNFIIARDSQGSFSFASLQSDFTRELLASHGITLEEPYDTFILYDNGTIYDKSDAALRIAARLDGLWKLLTIFRIVPTPIRNFFYSLIARNRYRLFGKKESCMIPPAEVRGRFLG